MREPKATPTPINFARLSLLLTCTAICAASAIAQISSGHSSTAVLATSDERISLVAGDHAPRLIDLVGHSGAIWHNESEETLPASVTIDNVSIPIVWSFKPELSSVNTHKVLFVYESSQPGYAGSGKPELTSAPSNTTLR
jgi:hypothetical protein